jgi:hypothetical protein
MSWRRCACVVCMYAYVYVYLACAPEVAEDQLAKCLNVLKEVHMCVCVCMYIHTHVFRPNWSSCSVRTYACMHVCTHACKMLCA